MKEGWEYVKLGDVIENLRTGLNPRTHFKLNTPDANGYYITVRELKGWNFKVDEKTDRINDSAIKRINERSKLKVGDILYSGTGTIGNTAIVNEEPTWWGIKEGVYAITPKRELYSNYLIYVFSALKDIIMSKASGTTVKSIPMRELIQVQIPLPSLSEQEEIVTYLDTSFAKIDAIKANAEKELEEAKKLFAAALNEAMTPKEGWVEKTLGEIGNLKNGMNFSKNEKGYTLRLLGVADFGNRFLINNVLSLPVLSLNQMPNDDYLLCDGDIVFVRSNGNKKLVGRSVLITELAEPTTYSGFCIRLRKTDNNIDAKYLVYYLKTSKIRKQMFGNGANISNLNQGILSNVNIYYPPLSEQQSIVTHLDTLSEKVRQLQSNYEKISSECDALKQAILRDTFE